MATLKLGTSTKKNALFLANASQAAYSKRVAQSAAFKRTDLTGPILIGDPNSKFGDFGFVAVNANSMVVALRGTDDIEDWLRNLDFKKTKAFGGNVHQGFLEGVKNLYSEIEQAIDTLDGPRIRKLFVTGHSRGAAMATLLAAKLLAEKEFSHPKMTSVFGYGSPRVGDVAFFRAYQLREETHLYINEADPVPMAPLISQDYVHAANQTLLHDGRTREIDLDSSIDSAIHLWRVGVPKIKDHSMVNGYIKSLKNLR